MAAALPYQSSCCNSCEDPQIQNVPGAKGDPGSDGADGADGTNAYSVTTANFAMPTGAPPNPVAVSVNSTAWMGVDQVVYVENAGWMRVQSITDAYTVNLINLEDGSGDYAENVAPTTVVLTGSKVSPGGLQGIGGAAAGAAGGDLEGTYPDPTLGITTTFGDIIVNNNNLIDPRNTRLPVGADFTLLHADSGAGTGLAYRAVDLTGVNTSLAGALPIANGGTGQAAKTASFDALSPTTNKGDLIIRNAANNVRQAIGADDLILIADSAQVTGVRWAKIGPENLDTDTEEASTATIILRGLRASGVDGDASLGVPNSWITREITEISQDTTATVVLSAQADGHKFSLPQGYYRIHIIASGYCIGYHRVRFWDVTAPGIVTYAGTGYPMYGTTECSPAGSLQPTNSHLQGRFYATAGHEFCVDHYAQLPSVAAGYGKASSIPAVSECYMTIMLERLAKA